MKAVFVFVAFLFVAVCAVAQPATYPSSFTAAQDGSGDFRTIQEAVNAVEGVLGDWVR